MRLFLFILIIGILFSCQENKQAVENDVNNKNTDPVLAELDRLNKKIQSDSLNGDFYQERADFYYENEEYNEALKDIYSSLELDSSYAGYYVTLSDIYMGMGKLKASYEALDKAIELDSENVSAYLKMAEISIIYRDYKKAIDYIDKALKVDELAAKGYFLRGVVFLENNDTIRGIRNFQKAIDVDQDYFEAHFQLGMLFADMKNKLAIDYFNNALNIKPANTEVDYYLAMYYQETGEYNKAIQIYNSILDNEPEFYFAVYNIGYINLVYLKEFETAIDYFTKAIEINPEYVEAFYNRAFAYELLHDVENSKKDYQKTLELSPNYELAVDGLNRIADFLSDSNN